MKKKINIPKIYIDIKRGNNIFLEEFPRGAEGKKLWDKLIHGKTKSTKKVKPIKW